MSTQTPPSGDTHTRRKERHRSEPLLPEVRFFAAEGLEVREQSDTNQIVVTGSPVEYNQWYEVVDLVGPFREKMMPGVATDILPTADVRFLFNHAGLPLARTVAGTMSLSDSATSLHFRAGLDARQQLANDLSIAIERGDVNQMSCGFIVAEDEWDIEDNTEIRTIHRFADLLDVSAVTYPASPTTHIQIAQRMMMEQPVETRARLRRSYRAAKRSGRADELLDAVRPLIDLEERDVDVDPGEDTQTPTGTGRLGSPDGDGDTYADAGTDGSVGGGGPGDSADASGTRSEWPTRDEHRAQLDSFNDIQRAVCEALLAAYPPSSGDRYDLYVCDIGSDWVVWQTYEPPSLFQVSYTTDDSGAVTFGGDPRKVAKVVDVDYVPAAEQTSQSSRAKALQLRAKALKASLDA